MSKFNYYSIFILSSLWLYILVIVYIALLPLRMIAWIHEALELYIATVIEWIEDRYE